MARIVLKFGGTSVADPERIGNAADKIVSEVRNGHQVVVVVSAMAGVTNQLVEYCQAVNPLDCDPQEYDAVVSTGEQVTTGLMALALEKRGVAARSFMGWQVPILCNNQHGRARIEDIPPENLEECIGCGMVPVIAGFQGVSQAKRISTLGRGGSDTTAVAIAAALKADRCDIYTDVDGVYTSDPRLVPLASKLDRVTYEEMLEMAALGAKVLHPRSVELAMAWKVPLQVLSSFGDEVGSAFPGTLITEEDSIMEKQIVNGVTYTRNEAKLTLLSVPDMPGVAAMIFAPLGQSGINVDVIVQNISPDGKTTDMTFTVPRGDADRAKDVLQNIAALKGTEIRIAQNIAKISIVGIGMISHSGVAQTMFTALAENNINIQAITTSEIKISVLIDEKFTELAVRTLHTAFGLDQTQNAAS